MVDDAWLRGGSGNGLQRDIVAITTGAERYGASSGGNATRRVDQRSNTLRVVRIVDHDGDSTDHVRHEAAHVLARIGAEGEQGRARRVAKVQLIRHRGGDKRVEHVVRGGAAKRGRDLRQLCSREVQVSAAGPGEWRIDCGVVVHCYRRKAAGVVRRGLHQ